MNLLLALVFVFTLRIMDSFGMPAHFLDGFLGRMMWFFVLRNLGLMFFNLIPIHPLDGSKILSGSLPPAAAYQYDKFVGQYGPLLILGLAWASSGTLSRIIMPAVMQTAKLILGPGFFGD